MSPAQHGHRTQAERLRAAGLRVTVSRIAVLDVLDDDGHPTVDQVLAAVRQRLGAVSQQAVYGILHDLEAAGMVQRIEPTGHPARYETRVGDNHHHLVCRGCGRVTDVDCSAGRAPCLTPARDAGYLVETADVTYWGLCPGCRDC
ncbi:MAG TPA: Fur family transcriptional regulator [Streptosporangiaceae bacterium]|nr:Fur family transcriptional regulator [Streptosporangiaceae bacterium]